MAIQILTLCTTFIGGLITGIFIFRRKLGDNADIEERKSAIVEKATKEAGIYRKQAKQRVEEVKNNSQASEKTFHEFLKKIEESIKAKEDAVSKREAKIQELKLLLAKEQEEESTLDKENKEISRQIFQQLEKKSGKTTLTAREYLIKNLEQELHEDNEIKLKKLEECYKENAEKEARNIISNALQRLSTPTSNEKKGSQLKVLNDSNKPNVVGANAENILFLEEQMDNTDIIFNDFAGIVTISHYNLITRQITKKTLEKMFDYKGKITKDIVAQKIEEAKKDVDRELLIIGREALKRMNIKRTMPDECLQTIGRLQFRTSYGQNIMRHSYEVGIFALMMAYELNLDIETAKISGFLHDLGKAIDQNPDIIGAHDYLTKELMEKYKCFHDEEIHAAWTHHDSEPPKTPEAFLVKGADAMSAGRPGARAESLDKYIDRLNALQDIAMSYEGVDKVSAMSAGRELRVMVSPGIIHDKEMQPLADVIAGEIKENVAYPGYVRVNIIRTTKSADIARPKA